MFDISFDPLALLGMLLCGLIGTIVLFYEKRNDLVPQRVLIGVALCIFPYFVSTGWIVCAIGLTLCAGLFVRWE